MTLSETVASHGSMSNLTIGARTQALQYAGLNLPVFPVHGFYNGSCTCGSEHDARQAGKHPALGQTFRNASTDPQTINSWFDQNPTINFGVATGIGDEATGKMLVVIDVDSYKEGADQALDGYQALHGKFPDTAIVHTGGGGHHYYFYAKVGSRFSSTMGNAGIDIKGIGGYVIGAGSTHRSGKLYDWEASSNALEGQRIADLPEWIYVEFGKKLIAPAAVVAQEVDTVLSADDVAEIESYLAVISADTRETWLTVIMACKSRSESEQMFIIVDKWSATSEAYKGTADVRRTWDSVDMNGGITFKSLRRLADLERAKTCNVTGITLEANTHSEFAWTTPGEIAGSGKPTAYPLDALPKVMKEAVEEVQAFIKSPVAMVACSALSALSLAAQSLYDVQRAEGLTGPIGLFLLSVANSGERKSTLDGMFSSPIHDFEAFHANEAKEAVAKYTADHAAWDAMRKGILDRITRDTKEKKDCGAAKKELREHELTQPARPLVPRLIYSDVTPEALKHCLAREWPSGAVMSSEGGAVFGGHGMKKDNQMGNMATINELWDGKPGRTDRRTSESAVIKSARLTVAIQVQEATLRAFIGTSNSLARGTGFLARFMVAWPESKMGTRSFSDAPSSWAMRDRYRARLAEILAMPQPIFDGELKPAMLYLSKEAKAVWVAFHDAIEAQLAPSGEYREVCDVASKTADNAVRVAALFHILDGSNVAITEANMISATRVAHWHLNESKRLFGGLMISADLEAAAKLNDWLVDYCKCENVDQIDFTTLLQRGPSSMRKKANVEQPIAQLASLGRVRDLAGSPRRIWVNPALLC